MGFRDAQSFSLYTHKRFHPPSFSATLSSPVSSPPLVNIPASNYPSQIPQINGGRPSPAARLARFVRSTGLLPTRCIYEAFIASAGPAHAWLFFKKLTMYTLQSIEKTISPRWCDR